MLKITFTDIFFFSFHALISSVWDLGGEVSYAVYIHVQCLDRSHSCKFNIIYG